ncbi:hypothetical protein AB0N65_01295 [Paenarthrobacter sp. NPDC089322]|uniref:hypothetical protein n=1 Tax=Paenarthrobacter sp. NPDC089322 TaxID=3155065 RepID=UPI0034437E50
MSTTTFDRTTGATLTSGSGLRQTRLIIRREILTRLGNRTILTATGLLALFAGAVAGIGGWFVVDSLGDAGTLTFDPRAVFATAMISALLASLVYSASSLTSGVVEEKSSRIVEIIRAGV